MRLQEKLEFINRLLIRIISLFHLTLNSPLNFNSMALILFENELISAHYHEKIKSLDSYFKNNLEFPKSLISEIDDIQFYLETRFYHYI